MRQCVTRDGSIDFGAWRALGEDVTTEEFLQLETVALFEADLRWEQTDYYSEWVKSNPSRRGVSAPVPRLAVQVGPPDVAPVKTEAEIMQIIRQSRLLARKAQAEGMRPDADPVEWLRQQGVY